MSQKDKQLKVDEQSEVNRYSRFRHTEIRKIKSPIEILQTIPENTLDDGILESLGNQVKSICLKFSYVLLPRSTQQKTRKLRNWDLWGPFIMCIIFGLFVSNSDQFIFLILTVFGGGLVVSFNTKLLGGQISFLQSVAILGYCIFPLFAMMILIFLLKLVQFNNKLVKLIMIIVATLWCVIAARVFISVNLPEDRKFVGLYPIIIFYIFVGTLLFYV